MFKQLPDTYVDSSKHKPVSLVNVSNVNATVMKQERDGGEEVHFSVHMEEPIDPQNNDTFCSTILNLINDKKVYSDKYFIGESGLLHFY